MYIDENGVPPGGGDTNVYEKDLVAWSELETQLKPYIAKLPRDPCGLSCLGKGSRGYGNFMYEYSRIGSNYGLEAPNFESKSARFVITEGDMGSFE